MNRYIREFGEITELVRDGLLRTTNDSLYDKGVELSDLINQLFDLSQTTDIEGSEFETLVAGSIDGLNIPVGGVTLWPVNPPFTLPDGRLICDGSAVSRTTYANLYGVIGTYYGNGDGSTTFNIPNYQEVFFRFTDSTGVRDPNYNARSAAPGGSANTVGSTQGDATAPNGMRVSQAGGHDHDQVTSEESDGWPPYDMVSNPDILERSDSRVWTNLYTHNHGISGGDSKTKPLSITLMPLIRY